MGIPFIMHYRTQLEFRASFDANDTSGASLPWQSHFFEGSNREIYAVFERLY